MTYLVKYINNVKIIMIVISCRKEEEKEKEADLLVVPYRFYFVFGLFGFA
jgi:hypothetical protein